MSIWGTWLDLDEETPGVRGPIVYRGSHIMPTDQDDRDGSVDVSAIDGWIPHDGKVLCDEDDQRRLVWPWLRLSVIPETVILDRAQVAQLYGVLGRWLGRSNAVQPADPDRCPLQLLLWASPPHGPSCLLAASHDGKCDFPATWVDPVTGRTIDVEVMIAGGHRVGSERPTT